MICFAYASNKGPPAVKMKLSSFENVLLANKFSCHVLDFRKSLIFFLNRFRFTSQTLKALKV
jgi:hypothetical protein